MKTLLNLLFILLGLLALPHAFSQTSIVDQANEVHYPPSTWNIEYFRPVGQEFTPALASLNFVDLMLMDFYGHGYLMGELAVGIHAGTIYGPLLGTSQSLFLQPTFQGVGHFEFSTPVALTPGDTYVIKVSVLSGGDWGVGTSGVSAYANGQQIKSGVQVADNDLFFREGIIVPEPNTLACFGLGLGIRCLLFRRRPRS